MKTKETDIWSAMREMYASTGVALVLSAGTTVCGFSVLLCLKCQLFKNLLGDCHHRFLVDSNSCVASVF